MGILDTILGRTKPVRPNLDALFAIPSAAVTLQSSAGLVLSGRAGVCWMPPAGQSAADVQREISQLLDIPDDPAAEGQATAEGAAPAAGAGSGAAGAGSGAAGAGSGAPGAEGAKAGLLTQAEDSYGYRWLVLDDRDVEDLVNRVHLVNSLLAENGWGPQLLCSVFGVVPGEGADTTARPFYLVYLYKRGSFFPFVPTGGERRDNEAELRLKRELTEDLPIEPDLSHWFPIWNLPLR